MSRSASNRKWRNADDRLGFNYAILPRFELNYASDDLFTYIINYSFPWRYVRSNFELMISAGWLDFACQFGFIA